MYALRVYQQAAVGIIAILMMLETRNVAISRRKTLGVPEVKNLSKTFVVPVILSNGQEVEVIVNKN